MLDTFLPEYEDKDIIIGYRADDSYFAFANAFLNNTLSLAQLEKAMNLGRPVVIDCQIDSDDKVWPMVAPGAAISEAFDEADLKNK